MAENQMRQYEIEPQENKVDSIGALGEAQAASLKVGYNFGRP